MKNSHQNWFPWSPADWMMGKIQRCSKSARECYVRLCCIYWNKRCKMTVADAVAEILPESFDELVAQKVVIVTEEGIIIKFLNNYRKELEETDQKGTPDSGAKTKTSRKKLEKKPLSKEEQAFLDRFNELKQQIRGNTKFNIRTLSDRTRQNFKKMQAVGYSPEEIDHAITAMLCSKWPVDTGNDTPDHLLVETNFIKYLNIQSISQAQHDPSIKATRDDRWTRQEIQNRAELSGAISSGIAFPSESDGISDLPAEDQDLWQELQS